MVFQFCIVSFCLLLLLRIHCSIILLKARERFYTVQFMLIAAASFTRICSGVWVCCSACLEPFTEDKLMAASRRIQREGGYC
jgi:hypothetical protein